jgi:hypothetical protein
MQQPTTEERAAWISASYPAVYDQLRFLPRESCRSWLPPAQAHPGVKCNPKEFHLHRSTDRRFRPSQISPNGTAALEPTAAGYPLDPDGRFGGMFCRDVDLPVLPAVGEFRISDVRPRLLCAGGLAADPWTICPND